VGQKDLIINKKLIKIIMVNKEVEECVVDM
jgi:hypothetical protein